MSVDGVIVKLGVLAIAASYSVLLARVRRNRIVLGSALAVTLLLASVAVTILWSGVHDFVALPLETLTKPESDAQARLLHAKELSARVALTWGTLLSLAAIGLALAYCYLVPPVRSGRREDAPVALAATASIGAVAGLLIARPWQPGGYVFAAYTPLLDSVHEYTSHATFPLENWGNGLLIFAAFSLVGSVWQATLDLPREIDAQPDESKAKDCLRAANGRLVQHLYLGSALLVTSVVALYFYYRWPAAVVADEAAHAALAELAVIIALLFGTVFTLALAFVLGPALLAVHDEAIRVARRSLGEGAEHEAQAWVVDNGLRPSGIQQGMQILAVLGPILTGPILQLLSAVD